eukprot:Nitzschia sp. Nitz4//scaffold87_size112219//7785//8189//NITZ4_004057-RA/size112219-processed-gene-0.1-mRNA-1//1//CDS//3329559318//8072//frame0
MTHAYADPLFQAVVEHGAKQPRSPQESMIFKESPFHDPLFVNMMVHLPKTMLPLHNYYSEFRLGQGDELFRAVMKSWPCTSTPVMEEHPMLPLTRCLTVAPCHTLANTWSPDPVYECSERRFVMLSDERQFVMV